MKNVQVMLGVLRDRMTCVPRMVERMLPCMPLYLAYYSHVLTNNGVPSTKV
ncbi:hypothetical protein [Caldalkalibacillus salinus]|uniref:hypothetical protein n=1 Tax=Caldalkalibacillus salinus TaxID=2803787 RepID=UPI0019214E07|nr:hypothetical protein [Caldalkalibacillus salinus]